MRAVKSIGVALAVFVVWVVAAIIVGAILQVSGQSTDSAGIPIPQTAQQERDAATFLGNAVIAGFVVALGSGAFYWYRAGKRKPEATSFPPTPD